jgi:TRAP-type C4-dicarboxylate transport system permease small subunit
LRGGMNRCAGWLFVLCALFVTSTCWRASSFGFSSQSTTELSGYMLGVGIAWGLAGALDARTHVRIDILIQKVPAALARLPALARARLARVFAGFLPMAPGTRRWSPGTSGPPTTAC